MRPVTRVWSEDWSLRQRTERGTMTTIIRNMRPVTPRAALRNWMLTQLEHPAKPQEAWLDGTDHWRFDPEPKEEPQRSGWGVNELRDYVD